MLLKTTIPLLFLAVTAAPALAQDAPATEAANPNAFVLEAGTLKIEQLVDQAAKFLRWNILSNPQELANAATGGSEYKLQNRITTDRAGCEDLLTTMLSSKGFVVRTLDDTQHLYEVIAMNGPRGREAMNGAPQRTEQEVLARPNLRMPVSTVIQMQHINGMVAVNALRPFFASMGGSQNALTIGTSGSSAILLTGMQDQVAAAIRMVRDSDVPPPVPDAPGLGDQVRELQQRVAALEKEIAELKKGK